jgi:hypothetical protein
MPAGGERKLVLWLWKRNLASGNADRTEATWNQQADRAPTPFWGCRDDRRASAWRLSRVQARGDDQVARVEVPTIDVPTFAYPAFVGRLSVSLSGTPSPSSL